MHDRAVGNGRAGAALATDAATRGGAVVVDGAVDDCCIGLLAVDAAARALRGVARDEAAGDDGTGAHATEDSTTAVWRTTGQDQVHDHGSRPFTIIDLDDTEVLLGVYRARQGAVTVDRSLDGDGFAAWVDIALEDRPGSDLDHITIGSRIDRSLDARVVAGHVDRGGAGAATSLDPQPGAAKVCAVIVGECLATKVHAAGADRRCGAATGVGTRHGIAGIRATRGRAIRFSRGDATIVETAGAGGRRCFSHVEAASKPVWRVARDRSAADGGVA